MTVPVAHPQPQLRRRGQSQTYGVPSFGSKLVMTLTLAFVCLWPLFYAVLNILIFNNNSPKVLSAELSDSINPGLSFRKYLDRVDIMGYGPTHPRVAVVVVGQKGDASKINATVGSVFQNTDLNRLFVVVVVMDGVESDSELVRHMTSIDQGALPHWHGLRPHTHKNSPGSDSSNEDGTKEDEQEPHGKKIHVIFSNNKQGMAASRSDAIDFISLLSRKHEKAGIKSHEEDLILLILQSGAELTSRKWLAPVTSALIVPPPLLGVEDTTVALKITNAVSFGIEHDGVEESKALGFDYTFAPQWITPSAKDMALSNGNAFPTPTLPGVATAMRLETYQLLPAQDLGLTEEWAANIDLSLNLWLCADGIDVFKDVTIKVWSSSPSSWSNEIFSSTQIGGMVPTDAARFAAAWMDIKFANRVFRAVTKKHSDLTQLEWTTMLSRAKGQDNFPSGLQQKCRSFNWYVTEVNTELNIDDEVDDTDSEKKASAGVDVKMKGEKGPLKQVEERKKEPEQKVVEQKKEPGQKVVEQKKEPERNVLLNEITPRKVPKSEEEGIDKLPPPPGEKKEISDAKDVDEQRKKPSKPLDAARLAIIQKAPQVDTTYVDVSNGHADHPHKGARDANGMWGYVHVETALKNTPPRFQFPQLKEACESRDNTYKMLTEQVFVDLKAHEELQRSGVKRDTIFCLVYTIDSGHDRIPFIRETWGPGCDGFMVGSNKTDPSIGAVDIPHEGPEEYSNIWQKVRSMWSYIYDNYYDKYDWFHIGGDDLYLITENLRLYLESEEIRTAQNGGIYLPSGGEKMQTPLFLGRRFKYMGDPDEIFNSGGSGYTLNKAALKTLVVNGFPNYFPHLHTFSEDTMVAKILKKMGVYPYDTKDEDGGERYNPFQPGHHWGYRPPANISTDWYAKYSIDVKWGKEHCAKRSVAFHYIKNDAHKRLHALMYHLCPK